MGTQELHRGYQSCLCAHQNLPLSLQGIGLFDDRGSGTAVPVRGERDETLGGGAATGDSPQEGSEYLMYR
jgi:hypothetical protein